MPQSPIVMSGATVQDDPPPPPPPPSTAPAYSGGSPYIYGAYER